MVIIRFIGGASTPDNIHPYTIICITCLAASKTSVGPNGLDTCNRVACTTSSRIPVQALKPDNIHPYTIICITCLAASNTSVATNGFWTHATALRVRPPQGFGYRPIFAGSSAFDSTLHHMTPTHHIWSYICVIECGWQKLVDPTL
jgi:hypothetical protein